MVTDRHGRETGYSDLAEKWGGSNSILSRVNFATSLAFGRVQGAKPDYEQILLGAPRGDLHAAVDWMCRAYLGRPPSAGTEESLVAALDKAKDDHERGGGRRAGRSETIGFLTTLILSSPDFQMR